jgi:chromosome segregation ATPase
MITETKKRLTHLVEINRALSSDLDISRRMITNLSRERDALRSRVDTLENEIESVTFAGTPKVSQCDVEGVREELLQEQYKVNAICKERDIALRDAETAKARCNLTEQRFRSLIGQLDEVKLERDEVMVQLEESNAAFDEIRYRLVNLPEGSLLDGLRA